MIINGVTVTECGWAGHFICADSCKFRRNTHLEYKGKKWVISTVGCMVIDGQIRTIGYERWYETMAFWADEDSSYDDADYSRDIYFDSESGLYAKTWDELINKYVLIDLAANKMHEDVVKELIEKIREENLNDD